MTLRHLAAAAITAGALVSAATPASATCWVGPVDICNLPTDPYTDPITEPVVYTVLDTTYDTLCLVDPIYCGG